MKNGLRLLPNHCLCAVADADPFCCAQCTLHRFLSVGIESGFFHVCTGLVGMIRNWTFTLFFCMTELWGDVCLGLLFWGLANDTTHITEAPTLYPLFGLGANLAQAMAGLSLKFASSISGGASAFTFEMKVRAASSFGRRPFYQSVLRISSGEF